MTQTQKTQPVSNTNTPPKETFSERAGIQLPSVDDIKKENVELKNDAEVKTRRKRRSTIQPEIDPKEKEMLETNIKGLTFLVTMGFRLICVRSPNPLPLTETEESDIEKGFSPLIQKYAALGGKWMPEITAAGTAAGVLIPRFLVKKEKV